LIAPARPAVNNYGDRIVDHPFVNVHNDQGDKKFEEKDVWAPTASWSVQNKPNYAR